MNALMDFFSTSLAGTIDLAYQMVWLWFPFVLFGIAWGLWISYVQMKFRTSKKWVLLEIKIPREILKTPEPMTDNWFCCENRKKIK